MWQSFCGKVAWSNTNVCDDFVQKMTENKSCKYGDYGSFEDLGPTIKVLARCLGLPSRCWPGVLAYHQGASQVSWPTIKVLTRCLGLPSRCWPGLMAYHQGAGQVSWPTIKVLARCLGLHQGAGQVSWPPSRCWPGVLAHHQGAGQVSWPPSRCWPGVLAYHQGASQVSWPTIKVLARCHGLPSRCWPGVLAYHQGADQVSWPTIKVLARFHGLPSRCWPGVLLMGGSFEDLGPTIKVPGVLLMGFSSEAPFLYSSDLLVWPTRTVGAEVIRCLHLSDNSFTGCLRYFMEVAALPALLCFALHSYRQLVSDYLFG